jgi:transcriptional regulator GlxA family with amidase domain
VQDISLASGIGVRALQLCFRERFRMGPMEYLRLRRLHEARAVLGRGSPGSVTVTDVALLCGFSHLGRFSHYYRSTFGETPRQALNSRDGRSFGGPSRAEGGNSVSQAERRAAQRW